MPLPASGTITLNDIQTEFGGTNPISLSEYYRGGGLVPDTPTNAGVPTSGEISLSDFYGASAVSDSVTLSSQFPSSLGTVGGTTTIEVRFATNGNESESLNGGSFTTLRSWWSGAPSVGIGSSYEIRATVTSGSLSTGTTGTWLALSTNRSFSLSRSGTAGITTAQVLFEIRDVATSTVQDSATYTFSAQLDF